MCQSSRRDTDWSPGQVVIGAFQAYIAQNHKELLPDTGLPKVFPLWE
jgi:hypothetical protein